MTGRDREAPGGGAALAEGFVRLSAEDKTVARAMALARVVFRLAHGWKPRYAAGACNDCNHIQTYARLEVGDRHGRWPHGYRHAERVGRIAARYADLLWATERFRPAALVVGEGGGDGA